jgi:hypothetical protein
MMDAEFVPERFFRGQGFKAVPEWAILFVLKVILLFEYSTSDNCRRTRLMRKKINTYKSNLSAFEEYFEAKPVVLFLLEIPAHAIPAFVARHGPGIDAFYFTDLASFMNVEPGKQLSAPIYTWGRDGKKYSLR